VAKRRKKRAPASSPNSLVIKGSGDIPPNEDAIPVAKVARKERRDQLKVGKVQPIIKTAMRSKVANIGAGSALSGGGLGGLAGMSGPAAGGTGVGAVGGSTTGSGGNFYSPELSTDFLELPQSLDEQRNYYRFFYRSNPFVGQAIDVHTELPLSKLRLGRPEAEDQELAKQALDFCKQWIKDIGLMHRLIEIVHEYHLIGEVFLFIEDLNDEMPEEITHSITSVITDDGELEEIKERLDDADEKAAEWLRANYRGWTAIRVLPPEQIHLESFPFTDEKLIELIPDSKTKAIIEMADQGDQRAKKVAESMPADVYNAVKLGNNIPLNTDPDAGSFCHYMANKRSQYEPRGHSKLERCMRTIVYQDKLRQAQTSIASRHMTPIRLVYAENMNEAQTEELRDQIDLALQDPDYSIVTNFQVTWEEMTSNGRLLELSGEYDLINRELYAGLGVTESLLSGESSYSGDRINLEVINVRYQLLREILKDLVEEYFFKPMCRRMGFIENRNGRDFVVYPTLSFTRLALRDNQDTYDALFNLYSKGSIPISVILDLLNIDPISAEEELKEDFATFNDATFNEVLRSAFSGVGNKMAEETDLIQQISQRLGLKWEKPQEEGGGRF
jgi:hypothetical protein